MRRTAALALLFGAAAAAAPRPPERNCAWTTPTDAGLGVELRTQTCDFGFRTVTFETSAKDTTISVVPKRLGFLGAGKTAFTISPDEDFAAEIAGKAGDQIPPPPCGDMRESSPTGSPTSSSTRTARRASPS
ncbi:MAG: hypothetical protein KGL74_12950 [Elusimicrobia bacterium]|nr:hypothetical protein [Elusimicrobiota bacterium]